MPNEVIVIYKCGSCGREFTEAHGGYSAAENCTHGAESLASLSYPIGARFIQPEGIVIEIIDKIIFPSKGIPQAYYKVNWGGRLTKIKHSTVERYQKIRHWKLLP